MKKKELFTVTAKQEFVATLSFIDPVLNTQTRTATVKPSLRNSDGLLKPGMFVTVKAEGTTADIELELSIAASAVIWTGERSLVYVKTNPSEPVFEMREVTLGNPTGETFAVVSRLQDGHEIITNGTFCRRRRKEYVSFRNRDIGRNPTYLRIGIGDYGKIQRC